LVGIFSAYLWVYEGVHLRSRV